jgi:hypothetical protein
LPACSIVRATVLTERGAQSAARTASRMAPADALGREAVERDAARVVVAVRRLDEAEGAGAGQLLTLDVAGEVHRHLEDDVADEREVLLDAVGDHRVAGCGVGTEHQTSNGAPTGNGPHVRTAHAGRSP